MFKVTNKGTRTTSGEDFWVSDFKVFNDHFDNVIVSLTLLLLLFSRKIPLFWKIKAFIGDGKILI